MSNLMRYTPVGRRATIDDSKKYHFDSARLRVAEIHPSRYACKEDMLPESDKPYTFMEEKHHE